MSFKPADYEYHNLKPHNDPRILAHNEALMRDIAEGNKKRRDRMVREQQEQTALVTQEAFRWANDRSYYNIEKAQKEVQKVVNYYKK